MEQIIRQRDLYKSMLEQAGRSVPPLPTPPAAGGPSQEAAAPAAELLALPAPGAPDYKALYTDLTAELEKVDWSLVAAPSTIFDFPWQPDCVSPPTTRHGHQVLACGYGTSG